MPAQPLLLDSSAATSVRKQGNDLIDALAYADPLPEAEREAVRKLIEEEAKRSLQPPSSYLSKIPAVKLKFEGHPLLQHEMDRVKNKLPMPALDTQRYHLHAPPKNRANDVAAWKQAVDNAYSQLEHQYNRATNLELLQQFGSASWRAHNAVLDAHVKRLEAELKDVKARIESLNRERKLSQLGAASKLQQLQQEWWELIYKNAQIEEACAHVSAEVAALESQATAVASSADGNAAAANGAAEHSGNNASAAANGTAVADAVQPQQPTANGDASVDHAHAAADTDMQIDQP